MDIVDVIDYLGSTYYDNVYLFIFTYICFMIVLKLLWIQTVIKKNIHIMLELISLFFIVQNTILKKA